SCSFIKALQPLFVNGQFHCDWCDFTTVDAGTFVQHIHHHNESPWKCSKCRHISLNEDEHQKHLKAHSGTFPFTCQVCGYGAVRNEYLQKHTAAVHRLEAERRSLWKSAEESLFPTNASTALKVMVKKSESQETQRTSKVNSATSNQNGRLIKPEKSLEGSLVDGAVAIRDNKQWSKCSSTTEQALMLQECDTAASDSAAHTSPNGLTVLMVKNKISLPPNCTTKVMGFKMVEGKKHLVLKVIPAAKQDLSNQNGSLGEDVTSLNKERVASSCAGKDSLKPTKTTLRILQLPEGKQPVLLRTSDNQVKTSPGFKLITNSSNPQINVSYMSSGLERSGNKSGLTPSPNNRVVAVSVPKTETPDKGTALLSAVQSGVSKSSNHYFINSPGFKGPVLLSSTPQNTPTDKCTKTQPTCFLLQRSVPFVQSPTKVPPSEAEKPILAPRPIRPPSLRKRRRKALFDELPETVHKSRRLSHKTGTEKETPVLWKPVAKDTARTLRLSPFSGLQLVRCPRRYQPVVVLNHPDADIPEVANIMRVVNRHKGAVSKVSLSQETVQALSELAKKFTIKR
uniref:Si:ch211-214e3.5 n=1 Tax=Labrus bergylta TaxID=56723 RepID=A0A3Q3GK23_9LABR